MQARAGTFHASGVHSAGQNYFLAVFDRDRDIVRDRDVDFDLYTGADFDRDTSAVNERAVVMMVQQQVYVSSNHVVVMFTLTQRSGQRINSENNEEYRYSLSVPVE